MVSFLLDDTVPPYQEVRVVCVDDTTQTLTSLRERLRAAKKRTKKRIKGLETLSLTLALSDPASVPLESVVAMCQAVVRCFPKLKSLEISSEMDGNESDDPDQPHCNTTTSSAKIPIQILTVLLHPNKGLQKLRELTLDSVVFQADDATMRILQKAIARHDHLQQCYLYGVSMTPLSCGRSGMEKLVSAMAKRVEKLVLVGCRLAPPRTAVVGDARPQCWAGSCLVKVCKSTTLQEFKLHNLDELREEHIVLMSQALSTNKALRKLSILKSQELAALLPTEEKSKKLATNNEHDQLERLSSDAGTLALANMLRHNTALQELCLSAVDFNEYSALFFGNALAQDNTTLRDVWLMIPAHNGGTSSFPVDDPRMGYYLRLNHAGRRAFVTSTPSRTTPMATIEPQGQDEEKKVQDGNHHRLEWIESLVSSRRDIDCSFYKLREKPCLCG